VYAVRADHALVAAVHIESHVVTAVVADVRGRVLGRAARTMSAYSSPKASVADAVRAVRYAVKKAGRDMREVRGLAVAIGGLVDEDGVIHDLYTAPDWIGFSVASAMEDRLGLPCLAENDANLAALAEFWMGSARHHPDFCWVAAGERVGVGTLIRGTIHRGFRGASGELIRDATIERHRGARHEVQMLTSPDLAEREIALTWVERARHGDVAAVAQVRTFVEDLAEVLTRLAWTIAPPLIVLGGGLEMAADLLVDPVTKSMASRGTPPIEIRPSLLGLDAPLLGGIKLLLDHLDTELFGPALRA
jgi:predicted NBD/HSP70 family sugar kinase